MPHDFFKSLFLLNFIVINGKPGLRIKLGQIQDEKVKKHLNILEGEVAIANRIITDILTFGKVKEPQLTEVNLNNVIEGSVAKVRIPGNIEIGINLKNEALSVMGDEFQLKQVFSNIILNAVQAMPNGGILTITGIEKGKFMEVGISDTGEGIPNENFDKIFEPLFPPSRVEQGWDFVSARVLLRCIKVKLR